MKASIQVFELNSTKLIATYSTIEELMSNAENLMADQVVINDCVLYGWDEIYDFV